MAYQDNRAGTGTSVVAWIALVLAVAALALAWAAYNRAGENLEDQAAEAVDSVIQDVDEGVNQPNQPTTDDTQPAGNNVDGTTQDGVNQETPATNNNGM